jgi:hypothetical protein
MQCNVRTEDAVHDKRRLGRREPVRRVFKYSVRERALHAHRRVIATRTRSTPQHNTQYTGNTM